MKNIFINPELQYVRSGWRFLMFLLVFVIGAAALQFFLKWLGTFKFGFNISVIAQGALYFLLLVVTILWVRLYEKRSMNSVGLKINDTFVRDTMQGLLIGGGMMSGIFAVEWSIGFVQLSFKEISTGEMLQLTLMSALVFSVGAFGEELLFRGYLFQVLTEGTNKIISVSLFALFFASAHLGNPNVTVFSVVNIALAGAWLSIAYFKTRSLWFPTGLHFSWNFLQNHVFSFPVSGIDFTHYQLGVLVQSGPDWITGGSFGPEGGILATIMLFISSAFIYYSPWIRPSVHAWKYEEWIENRKLTVLQMSTADTETARQ